VEKIADESVQLTIAKGVAIVQKFIVYSLGIFHS
jgi:hypothetical protein